ncbi:MAG: cytochrome c [Bacteroidia bacterium]|nr:cytochrome c [Bacteroidia bacterium]MDW8158979.1 cytochrome c [Bacteroidia bacterium]
MGGCSRDLKQPFLEYAPQMYRSKPLEPYQQTEYNPYFKDGKNMQDPVAGTIARGKSDYYYPYEPTPEGYERAGKELKNPIPFTKENVEEGKRLYGIYCKHCHGTNGAGDGPVAAKISQPPPYNSARVKALTDGAIYHSITYGYNPYPAKGMGPHGSMLTPSERWKVVHYVKTLRGDPIPSPGAAASDSLVQKDKKDEAKKDKK